MEFIKKELDIINNRKIYSIKFKNVHIFNQMHYCHPRCMAYLAVCTWPAPGNRKRVGR